MKSKIMRSRKVYKNTINGLLYEAVVLICGFVLPRLIITGFGSEYNGITSAIKQFLQVISLFQAGIGGVTRAALYKPLYKKDIEQISAIIKTTESYLRKVVFIFIGVFAVFACILPLFVEEFGYLFTASLVLIMSISTFAQYFFSMSYEFILSADQRQGFMYGVNTVKVIANTVVSALLIKMGFGIHSVMLGSAAVYMFAPVFIYIYVNKKYKLIKTVKTNNSVLKQRWDNFGIQVAHFFALNTDLVVLSVFSNMITISVYTVYNLVLTGVFGLFTPFVSSVSAAFGNMLAKNEHELLKKNIRLYEQVVFALSTFLFGITSAMILFFVVLYTKNVTDAVYFQPLFAYILIVSTLFRAFRYPYMGITQAAGHFKQNRNLSFVEAGVNIVISIGLVIILDGYYKLVGVAIGTLFAYAFRTVRYAMYMSKYIIPRSNVIFIKRIVLSLIVTAVIAALPYILPFPQPENWMAWVIYSAIISVIAGILVLLVELFFYRNDLKLLMKMINNIFRKKGRL